MQKKHILYTVVFAKKTCCVKFAVGPAYEVKTWGRFDDPGNASQEFKMAVPGDHEYLDEPVFVLAVAELVERYQKDLAVFNVWQEWARR